MKIITLSLRDAETAREAAAAAAEYMRENAETHERYCEAEFAAQERADEDRFEALYATLDSLIAAVAPDPPGTDSTASRSQVLRR